MRLPFTLCILTCGLFASCTTTHHPTGSLKRTSYSDTGLRKTLATHVTENGRVHYTALKERPAPLADYYRTIASISPDNSPEAFATEDARLAYWINAYNSTALWNAQIHYPIESVLDLPPSKIGFFVLQKFVYGGVSTNLYYLENKVIRKRFPDPRIHFALNCASIGCPQLPQIPFTSENLQVELDRETYKFINSEDYVRVNGSKLELSSIFKWYEKDFTNWILKNHPGRPATLLSYVKLYAHPSLQAKLQSLRADTKIEFIPYDWSLNNAS